MIQHPLGEFALFVGELPAEAGPESGLFARNLPFEVWVNGAEQPRGLAALAKTLSMDMRANDAAWLQPQARRAGHGVGRALVRDAVAAARRAAPVPRRGGGHRGGDPLALRAARRAAGAAARRRCSTRCSAATSRAPAPRARWRGRWTCPTRPAARRSPLTLKEVQLPADRRRARDAAVRDRLLGQLPARARRPGAPAVARHAGDRPGVDRHEAAQAAQRAASRSATSWRRCRASAASSSGRRRWPTSRGW